MLLIIVSRTHKVHTFEHNFLEFLPECKAYGKSADRMSSETSNNEATEGVEGIAQLASQGKKRSNPVTHSSDTNSSESLQKRQNTVSDQSETRACAQCQRTLSMKSFSKSQLRKAKRTRLECSEVALRCKECMAQVLSFLVSPLQNNRAKIII
jgi:hypothetical protein